MAREFTRAERHALELAEQIYRREFELWRLEYNGLRRTMIAERVRRQIVSLHNELEITMNKIKNQQQ